MLRDKLVIFLGECLHKDFLGELLDFCGLCAVMGLIALAVIL